ncbi:MAG TPA: RDD family protein [Myxococcota bacterium]
MKNADAKISASRSVTPVPPFPRFVAKWMDVVYGLATLLPFVGALLLSMRGLMGGGLALGGLTGLVSVGLWDTLKGGALGVLGLLAVGLGLTITLWLQSLQWLSVSRTGATFGKRAAGIKMVNTDGETVGFFRGVFLRRWVWLFLLSWPSTIALGLDHDNVARVLSAAAVLLDLCNNLLVFTPQRRSLNDMFAGTVVVSAVARPSMRSAFVVGVPAFVALCGLVAGTIAWVPGARATIASLWSPAAAPPPAPPPAAPVAPSIAPVDPQMSTDSQRPAPPTAPVASGAVADAGVALTTAVAASTPEAPKPVVYVDDKGVAQIVSGMDKVPEKYRARAHAP